MSPKWLIVILAVLIYLLFFQRIWKHKTKEQAAQGRLLQRFKHSKGTYVGGHPRCNDNFDSVSFLQQDGFLRFYSKPLFGSAMPEFQFKIKIDAVTDITFEDASTLESKVTLGRVLLVGVFALAWKKQKKNGLAFVVIEWNDGKFDHATTFSFEGKNAAQQANRFRNELIAACK